MKFCSECGKPVELRIPEGDDRHRHVCGHCDTIHYQNPRVIVGTLPVYEDKVLLCRRAIEPRSGLWTLPAGFMENAETTAEGALRETWEEACAKPANEQLYRMYDLPHINQVYVFYRAELLVPEFACGPESLDVRLFAEHEIPWQELAFRVVTQTLQDYFADRKSRRFEVKVAALDKLPHDSH
jgi:ADP-ribose pyrophosphatase YjhB (NUDIX family)